MKNKKLFLVPFLFLSFFQIASAQEESQVILDNQIVQSIERILFIEVRGSQRIEPDTIRSYMTISRVQSSGIWESDGGLFTIGAIVELPTKCTPF